MNFRNIARNKPVDIAARVAPVWQEKAACQGSSPDLFFDPSEDAEEAAVKICESCPVARDCLEASLIEEPAMSLRFGIRGGFTPEERSQIARARKATQRAAAQEPEQVGGVA